MHKLKLVKHEKWRRCCCCWWCGHVWWKEEGDHDENDDDDGAAADDGAVMTLLLWRCCVDGDARRWWWGKNIMTKYVGNNFLGKTLSLPELVVSFVLVSWWFVSFVSVVLGVLVALWWCVRSVVSWRCPVMFWVFRPCFGCFRGVLASHVVSWWYWRNGIFSTNLAHLSTQKWASKETRNFAIGVVCWVNCIFKRYSLELIGRNNAYIYITLYIYTTIYI